MTKRREAMSKLEQDKMAKEAKEDVAAAVDAAVRKIEETEGEGAAERAPPGHDRGPEGPGSRGGVLQARGG